MTAHTRGMNRVDPYHVPNSPIARIMSTADQATARRQAIDAIRELHKPREIVESDGTRTQVCNHCRDTDGINIAHPCPTITTLDRHRV